VKRTQKLKVNTVTSVINRIVRIISGLILPRLILQYFGSETNGLVASINQFLSIITFLDMGVGSVVQSALYKPLAKNDSLQVSKVLKAANNYFRKIAYFLIIYVIALILFYPFLIDSTYDYIATGFLIFALSVSLFGQYYFGIVNELLLNGDQKAYIQYGTEIVVIILNLILGIILITQGASIQIVQLGSGIIFLLRPFFLKKYVSKNYVINKNVDISEDPLPQKWSGMAQHVAYTIQSSIGTLVLTIFSSLESVSVYSVYLIVVNGISILASSMMSGISSFFGNLLATNEIDALNSYFNKIEWIIHNIVIYMYGMTAVLITSFVLLYTSGIKDNVNYNVPLFALVLVLSKAVFSLRSPYQTMVFSAGHFKETEKSSIIEVLVNGVISVLLVNRMGIVGVVFGGLVSVVYRMIYLTYYLSRNIVHRPIKRFFKQFIVDIIIFSLILVLGNIFNSIYTIETMGEWLFFAIVLGIVNIGLVIIINVIFYREYTFSFLRRIF